MFGLHKGTWKLLSELLLILAMTIVFIVIVGLSILLDSVVGGFLSVILFVIICKLYFFFNFYIDRQFPSMVIYSYRKEVSV